MTPPKDRDALIEAVSRHLDPSLWAKIDRWIDDDDWNGATAMNLRKSALRDTEKFVTAIESSGCFVGPVVATENMRSAGEDAIDNAFTSCLSEPDTWQTETTECWTAMQSANPYKKDPSQ